MYPTPAPYDHSATPYLNDEALLIGADLKLNRNRERVQNVLEGFRAVQARYPNARLVLAAHRIKSDCFSVMNWIEEASLSGHVSYHPYYQRADRFPVFKDECDIWIDDATLEEQLGQEALLKAVVAKQKQRPVALFVTCFHPSMQEGNSALMRQWLRYLREAGYRTHVLYYAIDGDRISETARMRSAYEYDLFEEVPVTSKLVGVNRNGLNVHVDDWCGSELLEATGDLVAQYSYDVAIVNYAFMSAVFEELPEYTRRVLITHDSFTDRNQRILADGFPQSAWVSLDAPGETLACRRADVVVALQDDEAAKFQEMAGDGVDVRVIGPLTQAIPRRPLPSQPLLLVGYLGSCNFINEHNLTKFLELWAESPILLDKAELILGGGICDTLAHFAAPELIELVAPRFVGRVALLENFFSSCDVFINPERGGTGIKIKTLEAMAHGIPVLSTMAGSVGTGSTSRFHSAGDLAALIRLVEEVASNRDTLKCAAADTEIAQENYVSRHRDAMSKLLGPPLLHSMPSRGDSSCATSGTPAVSIIVPFYGVEDFIGACLESIRTQEFDDFEVILVDDASPDGSRVIAERFANEDDRLHIVVHDQNQGLGPARNTGVHNARGKYLLFLDSDDVLAGPEALGTLVTSSLVNGSEVVVGSSERLLPDGSTAPFDRLHGRAAGGGMSGEPLSGITAYHMAMYSPDGRYLPIRAWGMLIERAYYNRLDHHFPTGEHEDLPHTPILYSGANSVYYEPRTVVLYRDRVQGLSRKLWTSDMLHRYRGLWESMRSGLARHDLLEETGDAAVKFSEHLVWKVQENGLASDAEQAVCDTLDAILEHAPGAQNEKLAAILVNALSKLPFYDQDARERAMGIMARRMPPQLMLATYRALLSDAGGRVPPVNHLPASRPVCPRVSEPDISQVNPALEKPSEITRKTIGA